MKAGSLRARGQQRGETVAAANLAESREAPSCRPYVRIRNAQEAMEGASRPPSSPRFDGPRQVAYYRPHFWVPEGLCPIVITGEQKAKLCRNCDSNTWTTCVPSLGRR